MCKKKDVAIVLGATGNMSFAVASVLMDIKKHSQDIADDIIIYHNNMSKKDKNLLNSIIPCVFTDYEFPIKDISKFNEAYFNQFTHLAYSRYECFNLLNQYRTVIWLDIDIMLQGDISGLLDYGKNGIGILPGGQLKEYTFKPIPEYDMYKSGYSTGTIVFTDKIPNYNNLAKWCYDKTAEYAEYLYLPDQAIFNLLLQKYAMEIDIIDLKKYCCNPRERGYKKAIIVHSFCPEKFWNFWNIKQWNQNYKNWLQMGGSPYKGKKASYLTVLTKKMLPDAPDPVRKTRQFLLYLINVLLNKFSFNYKKGKN